MINYIKDIFVGLYNLIRGMYITMLNMLRKKVTEQYPENRGVKENFDNFRGKLTMPHDKDNHHRCTACGICMINCPNATIKVIAKTVTDPLTGKDKKILDRHLYDLGSCIFCALCTQTCPQDALFWINDFEHSLFTRDKLNLQLNALGSSLTPQNKE